MTLNKIAALLFLLLVGCGETAPTFGSDGGADGYVEPDAAPYVDAGMDTATPTTDTGVDTTVETDVGAGTDSGSDSGTMVADAGVDAGPPPPPWVVDCTADPDQTSNTYTVRTDFLTGHVEVVGAQSLDCDTTADNDFGWFSNDMTGSKSVLALYNLVAFGFDPQYDKPIGMAVYEVQLTHVNNGARASQSDECIGVRARTFLNNTLVSEVHGRGRIDASTGVNIAMDGPITYRLPTNTMMNTNWCVDPGCVDSTLDLTVQRPVMQIFMNRTGQLEPFQANLSGAIFLDEAVGESQTYPTLPHYADDVDAFMAASRRQYFPGATGLPTLHEEIMKYADLHLNYDGTYGTCGGALNALSFQIALSGIGVP